MTNKCLPDCPTCHPRDAFCDRCDGTIPRALTHRNLDGGMTVTFTGWYGGTIDPFPNIPLTLCDGCARAFLAENAWLGKRYRDLEIVASPTGGTHD